MKRFILAACAGLLAAAMASPSSAADMPGPYVPPAYSPAFNWTGFYAGINGGYGFGKTNWTDTTGATTGDFNADGKLDLAIGEPTDSIVNSQGSILDSQKQGKKHDG